MRKDLNDLLFELRKALSAFDSEDLFSNDGAREKVLAEACIKYLKFFRYRVFSPVVVRQEYTKIDQLRDLFYSLAKYHYGDKFMLGSRGLAADRAAIKAFVESRMRAEDISRKEALNECALVIQGAFEYKELIGLDVQLTLSMFIPGKFSWFVDKVIQLMNEHLEERYDEKVDDRLEKLGLNWDMF